MAFNEKYVTVAGAGLHDGSSEANAWTLAEAHTSASQGDRLNIKAGTYSVTTILNSWMASSKTQPSSLRGYKTTIGDLDTRPTSQIQDGTDRPLIVTSTGYIYFGQEFVLFENLAFETTSSTRPAAYMDVGRSVVKRCKFLCSSSGAANAPMLRTGDRDYNEWLYCHFDGGSTTQTQSFQRSQSFVGCVFENCYGIKTERFGSFVFCVFRNMTNGLNLMGYGWSPVMNCTFYNLSGYGIYSSAHTSSSLGASVILNNVFHTIGSDGIANPNADYFNYFSDNNLFYNVTGSNCSNTNLGTCRNELTDSTDPFVDASAGDYRLVSASNGYGKSQPFYEKLAVDSQVDIGAFQHADPAGSSSTFHPLAQ
jgi:hypothetical protein